MKSSSALRVSASSSALHFDLPDALKIAILPFLVSRLLLGLAAGLAYVSIGFARPGDPQHPWPLAPWLSWDAVHYLRIARAGYPPDPTSSDLGFFPLLPLLLGAAGASEWAAVALGFVLGLAGFAVLAALTARVWDRQAAVRVCWLAAFWPLAIFWSAVYTEGLFLALAAGALWSAWAGGALPAAALGLAAGLLRPNGLMLALPLLVLLPAGWARLAALGPLPGPALFATYLWAHTGRPLGFLASQAGHHPLAVGHPFGRLLTLDPVEVLGFGFLLLAVAAAVWLATRPELGAWRVAAPVTIGALLLPSLASGSLASFGRYSMAAFPIYWALQRVPTRLLVLAVAPTTLACTVLTATGRLTP